MDIRFLGHAAFELSDGDTSVLIDPFLSGNPKAAAKPEDLDPTTILLTHGHGDHLGDTVDIAKRTGAPVLAITELAGELEGEGLEVVNVRPRFIYGRHDRYVTQPGSSIRFWSEPAPVFGC